MDDKRIGKRLKDSVQPPLVTISGGKIIPGADFVNLGGDYYGRLDLPHHPDTAAFTIELSNIVKEYLTPKRKVKPDENV